MITFSDDFNSLLAKVVENCDEISSYIQNTDFIAEKYVGTVSLESWVGNSWSRCLSVLQKSLTFAGMCFERLAIIRYSAADFLSE